MRGYIGDIQGTPSTGILIDERQGAFNPYQFTINNSPFGAYIDAYSIIRMSSTDTGRDLLSRFNIPAFEVGRANMSGSWREGQNSLTVNMNDVIFLAPNFNARPGIWATGSVSGSYTGNPVNASVSLSGSGLDANFNMINWDQNRNVWLSTITNGTGGLIGGQPNTQGLNFHGISAGTINPNQGTISGSATGLVR
jgi:hypothetical protein